MLLRDHLAHARAAFITAGISPEEAGRDAQLLAAALLEWDTATLLAELTGSVPPAFVPAYHALVARRIAREPMAYLLGRQEFWGLQFTVTPAVLIPRPETELIIESVCARITTRTASLEIADVGTGSGCLAVALAREFPCASVWAIDMSPDALAIASRNASAHGVADRVRTVQADLLGSTPGPFDVIVSNPPYVPVRDLSNLQPEVARYEPATALVAGDDGLAVVRRLVPEAAARLKPGGWLMVEIGFGQADRVRALFGKASRMELEVIQPDLQGIPRVAVARRSEH